MELSLLLIQKIVSLFLIMFLGYLLVRCRLVKSSDSRVISVLSLYLIIPCTIISAFEVDFSPEVRQNLLLAVAAAVLTQGLLVLLSMLLSRVMKLDAVEKLSLAFSNAGNLIIPLVMAVLGPEWVIYTSAYISVQLVLLWSYGKAVLCGEKKPDVKKIVCNVNMIAILAGLVLLVSGLRLPALLQDTVDSLGAMLGPSAMLVTGMLIAGMDLKKAFRNPRLWRVVLFRLVLLPLCTLAVLKFSGLTALVPEGRQLLLITLLATITPSASTITQMAQVYGRDADYAGAVNVASTLGCIITMPIIVSLYLL